MEVPADLQVSYLNEGGIFFVKRTLKDSDLQKKHFHIYVKKITMFFILLVVLHSLYNLSYNYLFTQTQLNFKLKHQP